MCVVCMLCSVLKLSFNMNCWLYAVSVGKLSEWMDGSVFETKYEPILGFCTTLAVTRLNLTRLQACFCFHVENSGCLYGIGCCLVKFASSYTYFHPYKQTQNYRHQKCFLASRCVFCGQGHTLGLVSGAYQTPALLTLFGTRFAAGRGRVG